ncbi:MAG: hypothetical protein Unbinned1693contig1002_29 [Prokaryotic dsDNA virus sp.]|jgi:hypothetical protein|nr:MAG: hypothetical protein Unbinned1693contig1002_29 [Prokaryotic dsDNA virus sp.]
MDYQKNDSERYRGRTMEKEIELKFSDETKLIFIKLTKQLQYLDSSVQQMNLQVKELSKKMDELREIF